MKEQLASVAYISQSIGASDLKLHEKQPFLFEATNLACMSCTEVVPGSGMGTPAEADNMADFGDFAITDAEQGDVESEAEPCEKYDIKQTSTSRVFYPIYVGEVLNGRYLVEHKIGFGGFSTVWMAHDLEEHTDVALKIMSLGEEWGEHEIRIQDEITRSVRDTSHLVLYTRTFLLFRGDGSHHHRVQVLPLVGPPPRPWILKNVSMRTRMFAARQLLETLGNLHDAGIIHRDLNETNCMWGFTPLHDSRRTAKYAVLGRPSKMPIPYSLWKQGELVQPIKVPESLRTETFYLADFTLAMKVGDPVVPKGYPPLHFCSPDRLHKQEPSFACDIWSYMVLFGELYLGHSPFNFAFRGGIISCLTYCLGPLPEHWKGLYVYPEPLDFWYNQERMPDPRFDLASVIEKFRPDADPAEKQLVLSVMQKVFIYDPEKRPTARQLLRDPSFRAIMERYGC